MKRGKLYGVGVGPGDPELLTLKAQRVLQAADVIASPGRSAGEGTALRVVADWIEGKPLLPCEMPMTRDPALLEASHHRVANAIAERLDRGEYVAFVTLGDPGIYATYMYIHRRIAAMGYETEIVPGVPSFCAAAARLGMGLCEGKERLLIVPASHSDMSDCLETDANLVFMKAGRELGTLREKLARHGLLESASMVANCGLPEEQIHPHFANAPLDNGYFSLVIVKKGER